MLKVTSFLCEFFLVNRVYSATIRPIMTYVIEARMEKQKIRQMMEANEQKVLRKIVGETKIDRIKNQTNQRILRYPTYK